MFPLAFLIAAVIVSLFVYQTAIKSKQVSPPVMVAKVAPQKMNVCIDDDY